jgi:hypothetical protein
MQSLRPLILLLAVPPLPAASEGDKSYVYSNGEGSGKSHDEEDPMDINFKEIAYVTLFLMTALICAIEAIVG